MREEFFSEERDANMEFQNQKLIKKFHISLSTSCVSGIVKHTHMRLHSAANAFFFRERSDYDAENEE